MKKKIIAIVLPISMLLTFIRDNNSNTGYIKIEYLGEVDKPYNVVIFYLPSSIDTGYENFYTSKIEVTEMEFEGVRKSIEDRKFESAETLPFDFQFTIAYNEEKMFLLTKYIATVRQIFQNIIKQIKDINKVNSLKKKLGSYMRRLGYSEVLD